MRESLAGSRRQELSPGAWFPALHRWLSCVVAGAILSGCAGGAAISFEADGGTKGRGVVRVEGIGSSTRARLLASTDARESSATRSAVPAKSAREFLMVRVVDPSTNDLPPLAGDYHLDGESLSFEPRFGFEEGLAYRARFRPDSAEERTLDIRIAAKNREPETLVEAIYPTSDTLPENLLRLYIVFSRPMARGEAWQHLRIERADGSAVEMPFLEIDEELWDRDQRRLTVLIDPGRIKHGVRPHEELGPALRVGERHTLLVDPAWEDAEGLPLAAGRSKAFLVSAEDRKSPAPDRWRIEAPRAGTRDALIVHLDEPLDHGLLHSSLGVEDPDDAALAGEITVAEAETLWRFTPREPWTAGEHQLVIATTLEDLAGNSIGRPFEVDVLEAVRRHLEVNAVRVAFHVAK